MLLLSTRAVWPILAPSLLCAALAAVVGLFLATPTLNLDDLMYAANVRQLVHTRGFGSLLAEVIVNGDVGKSELRTYGLARAIQIVTADLFGKSAVATYSLVVLIHAAGSILIYRIMRDFVADKTTAFFMALMWFGSPAVLPYLKTEHHYLYLIAPYYPLFAWIWLVMRSQLPLIAGVLLLTATWLLGEGAIAPIAGAVLLAAWFRREPRLLMHGAIAGFLLVAYVWFQTTFIRDPTQHQRFEIKGLATDPGGHFGNFLTQLGHNGLAYLGIHYHDGELGRMVGGTGALIHPLTVLTAALLIAAMLKAGRTERETVAQGNRESKLIVIWVAALSLGLYLFMALTYATPLAVRYTCAFYGLMPIAVVLGLSLRLELRKVRIIAGVCAASFLALSIGSLYRAEDLVNQPNRELLAKLQPETAIVVDHRGWPRGPDRNVGGGYPGLISPTIHGLPNPMRSAWTAEIALPLYGGVAFGTSCEIEPNGEILVYYNGHRRGRSFRRESVKALGIADSRQTLPRELRLEDVCR